MTEKAYQERLERLFRQSPSVQTTGFAPDSYKPGLEGMRALDAATGYPSRQFACIHVAGTNGKGSVCSFLASALAAAGLRVGLYTSPHLIDFRERMKLLGAGAELPPAPELIGKLAVWEFLERYGTALEGRSFFEVTTAMAFWWFARERVDVAVIEVGLGGRLDSTNILEKPLLSIVTSIGLDHCALLGNSRSAIAAEKAGIFKPGVPALVGSRDEETAPVFERIAREQGAPLHFADREGVASEALETDLSGPCQNENLQTVRCALALLKKGEGPVAAALRRIGPSTLDQALRHTAVRTGLHGRWERLQERPEVLADIGHNPPALALNFSRLEALGRPLFIVYGIMADKDLEGIVPLMPAGAQYFLCAPDSPRALPAEALQQRIGALRPELQTKVFPGVAAATEAALEAAQAVPDALIYIGGSCFVVSEALPLWQHVCNEAD